MYGLLAVLIIAGIPAFIAWLISLFIYKRLVKTGNGHPRRIRIIGFIVSYILLFAAEAVWLLTEISFER